MELLAWNALVYFGSLLVLGAAVWKALMIAIVVTISAIIGYGKRWIYRLGFLLMVIALLVAIEILPPPAQWGSLFSRVLILMS